MFRPVDTRDPVAVENEVDSIYATLFSEAGNGFVPLAFDWVAQCSPAEFDQAVENLSAADVAAAAQTQAATVQQYHRLFMLPNVAHCGGGTGPSNIGGGTGDPLPAFRNADHDVVLALARWASTLKDGGVTRQRPVCV